MSSIMRRGIPAVMFKRRVLGFARRGILTLSYATGPTEPPLLSQTLGSHLASIVRTHGARTAIISRHQNQRLTYTALDTASTSLAHGLKLQGIERGARVGVMLGNTTEFALVTYAMFKLGAVLVPLNPGFTVEQVVAAMQHLEATHFVVAEETCLGWRGKRRNAELVEGVRAEVGTLRGVVVVGRMDGAVGFGEVVRMGERHGGELVEGSPLLPDEVVNIQFTSGTTSTPKAACLTHRNILNNGMAIGNRMLLTPEDIVCCPPPLFHCFGAVLGLLACTTHGSAIVFPAETFNAEATLRAVQEEGCTALHGVPTMFISELELLESGKVPMEGFDKLRTGIAAGSSVPLELMKRLHKCLNLTELTISYGMTETSPVSFMTTIDDPMQKKLDSVGRLLPHVSAKIVSPEDPQEVLPIGQRGELAISGYNVQKGYWNDPIKTAQAMIPDASGKIWMHTGDEAEMDKEGYIRITGRIKDLIIRGGENIRPLEVENCLLAHEAVQDACVVGLKDDRYGEVVAAFVRTHPGNELFSADETEGVEELRRWVRSRLSSHLVPKYVIPHVGDFPKTASGKIMKYVVREMGEGWRTWRRVEGVVKERVDGVSEVGCVEVSQAEGERVLAVVVGMEAGKRFCERETGGRVREVVETHCGVGLVPRYVLHLEDGLSKWGKGEIGGGGLQKLVQELVEKVEMGGNREGGDGWVQDRR